MKLYIKQKVFSWGDKFRVYDENGNDRYAVKGEVFTFGKKLHLYDPGENELAFIHQKVFSFLPKYYISRNGQMTAEVVKEFTFFKPEYSVNYLGWHVSGSFTEHDYSISDNNGKNVACVTKKWFSWGDTYEIDIAYGYDEINVLCVVLIIDAALAAQSSAAAGAAGSGS